MDLSKDCPSIAKKNFENRVKIEKEINKNLQKCIIEIQARLISS